MYFTVGKPTKIMQGFMYDVSKGLPLSVELLNNSPGE